MVGRSMYLYGAIKGNPATHVLIAVNILVLSVSGCEHQGPHQTTMYENNLKMHFRR